MIALAHKISRHSDDLLDVSREEMIGLLNEDLSRAYQSIIAHVVCSQILKDAAYKNIARELEAHAGDGLQHALMLRKQIDHLGGIAEVRVTSVTVSDDPHDLLLSDLENEQATIANYRQRIRQADAMGEYDLSESLREIVLQAEEHESELVVALGDKVSKSGINSRIS